MPASDWRFSAPHTIVWEPVTARDGYGKPSAYGAQQTYAGRRVHKTARVTSGAGGVASDAVSESQVWILGAPDVKHDDRVYVQGDSTYPPIVGVERYSDEKGDLFVKVWMGKAN